VRKACNHESYDIREEAGSQAASRARNEEIGVKVEEVELRNIAVLE
jgi:hypothetical protein